MSVAPIEPHRLNIRDSPDSQLLRESGRRSGGELRVSGKPSLFAEWNPVASGDGPVGRYFHAMAYDSYRGVGVLFGGADFPDLSGFADTWEWNGVEWIEADLGLSPAPGAFHAMAYDPRRRRVVPFGGGNQTSAT